MDWHIPIITLCFMCTDIVFGLLQAAKNKCLDSSKMRDGLFHKIGFIGAIVLAYLCEYALAYIDLGFAAPLAIPVCVFICLTEVVSILENLGKLAPELATNEFLKLFENGKQH